MFYLDVGGVDFLSNYVLLFIGVVWQLPYKEWLYIPTKELHSMTENNCENMYTTLCNENRKSFDTASNGEMRLQTSDPLWNQCMSVSKDKRTSLF